MGVFLEIDSDTTHRFFFRSLQCFRYFFFIFFFICVPQCGEGIIIFGQLKIGPQEGLLVPMVVASSVPMVVASFVVRVVASLVHRWCQL